MNRCRKVFLVFSLAVAVPLFARVISYAPYTNRVATVAVQDRAARHFVLIESTADAFMMDSPNEVVLYDTSGAEEPRVIGPAEELRYDQAALFEKPDGTLVVLAIARNVIGQNRWSLPPKVLVREGESPWREVQGLDWFSSGSDVADTDTGGRFTHGPFAPIVIGNAAWPFVVTLSGNGVWAIDGAGTGKKLLQAADARAVGRNAAGDRFLVSTPGVVWITGVDFPAVKVANVDPTAVYSGWITSGGPAYIQMFRQEGRFLFTATGGKLTFVAGPYGTQPPAIGSMPRSFVTMRFFAVPTHDYEGAWILQRDTGKPTTLSRHTPGSGLQTMWADISGPEVEALIPGASNQSLLVQVHREREGLETQQLPVDPALAVWRIGQPAPRSFEELYLNERWNKGFVHVDVEKIESGEPFVFNSGFEQDVPVSRTSPPIAGGGDVIQEWGVVRASMKQRLVLPGVSRLAGAFGSFWLTDVTLYNPLDDPQQVEVRFVPLGAPSDEAASAKTTLTLDAHEIRAIPDALAALFSIESGGGTLHLLPAVGINATARTYSRKGAGTFGFGMQAIDYFNAAGPRFPLSFAGAFPGEHFRTNLLLTDTSGRGAHARVNTSGVTGLGGANDVSVQTPGNATVQLAGVGVAAGLLSNFGGGLILEPTRGTAIATVVAIDNRTNDATYFPPDLPGSVARAIPVIGHVDGANGAKFRSDVYLYNPDAAARTVSLTMKKWDSNFQRTVNFTMLPGESRVIPDALKTLFGTEGLAKLTYRSTNQWDRGEGVRITSRTYTVEPSGATYGCLVPPLNNFQIGTFGDSLEILGASAGPGFRVNIGLVDLSETSQSDPVVLVRIANEKSHIIDEFVTRIPARGGMQLNDIFTSRNLTPPPTALVIVEIIDGQQIGAYATLTDNVTNDSTYLGAHLGAQPE